MSETSFNVTTRCPKTGDVCVLLTCSSGTAINCQLFSGVIMAGDANTVLSTGNKMSEQEIKSWNRCLDEIILALSSRVDGLMMSWKHSRAEELIKFKEDVLENMRK